MMCFILWCILFDEMFYLMVRFILRYALFDEMFYLMKCFIFMMHFILIYLKLNLFKKLY